MALAGSLSVTFSLQLNLLQLDLEAKFYLIFSKTASIQVWLYMLIFLALKRLKQEESKLSFIVILPGLNYSSKICLWNCKQNKMGEMDLGRGRRDADFYMVVYILTQ